MKQDQFNDVSRPEKGHSKKTPVARKSWRVLLLLALVGAGVWGGWYLKVTKAQSSTQGLLGHYYNDMDFKNLKLTRTDGSIDFDWGTDAPDPAIGVDYFSVRWTGQIQPRYSETYTFSALSDDGVRVWIDGQQVVNNWMAHPAMVDTGKIALDAKRKYSIIVEYYERTEVATMKLGWSSPSQPWEIVPQSQLSPDEAGEVGTRDPLKWPFAANSIWNMPIGSNANYIPANFGPADGTAGDDNYLIQTTSADPLRTVYAPGAWGQGRCTGTQKMGFDPIHVPDNLVVPDATNVPYYTPNSSAAFLQPDGRSLIQVEPLARCEAGSNVYGYIACGWGSTQDIEGDGLCGGHMGSGLSSIGGEIRLGELTNDQPIRHSLQLEVWGRQYLAYDKNTSTPGYRWPAKQSDSYAGSPNGYCSLDPCKSHPNPSLVQGSLLAIPPSVTLESLGLETTAAKKLFAALQDYGGYIVDDSGISSYNLGVEKGVQDEFATTYGYSFGTGAFHNDVNKLYAALQIIENNTPATIGGGGSPRAPLAPPFAS